MQSTFTVLICIDWFHPAYKGGGPIQSIANLVNEFQRPGLQFKILTSDKDHDGTINKGVPFNEWYKYNEYTQVYYTTQEKQKSKYIKAIIEDCDPNVLLVVGIYSVRFNLIPLFFAKAKKKIVSVRGMLHPGALSQKPLKKKVYLLFWKMAQLNRFYAFHATDEDEKKFIKKALGSKTKVYVAANFAKKLPLQTGRIKKENTLSLVSIALVSAMKNILLVLNALRSCKESISYNIYGPVIDQAYWQTCLECIDTLPGNVQVTYWGDVAPKEIENVLSKNDVFILPSKSENFGHALYEALSAGKPIITSLFTPWNNLENNQAGINVDLNSPETMIDAITFFAKMKPIEFSLWSSKAHDYSVSAINEVAIYHQYEVMFGLTKSITDC